MKKFLFLLAIPLIFAACKTTFAPAKNPVQIANLIDLQTSVNTLYSTMITTGATAYSENLSAYSDVTGKISNIVAANQNRPNAKEILAQSLLLEKYFNIYKTEHEKEARIPVSKLEVYRSYLQSFIKPILISELSLK